MSKNLIEQIEATRARLAKLEAALKSGSIVNNVAEGDAVTIRFGRAEKVRDITGKIVGVKEDETGKKTVAVLTDDFKTLTVSASSIIDNPAAQARAAEVAGSDEAVPHQPDAVDMKVAEEAGLAGEIGQPDTDGSAAVVPDDFSVANEDPLAQA